MRTSGDELSDLRRVIESQQQTIEDQKTEIAKLKVEAELANAQARELAWKLSQRGEPAYADPVLLRNPPEVEGAPC